MYRQFNIHKCYFLPTLCIYVFYVDFRSGHAAGGAVGWGNSSTSRKLAGSILYEIIGIYQWLLSSGRTIAWGRLSF
jgi:hypothetical protein